MVDIDNVKSAQILLRQRMDIRNRLLNDVRETWSRKYKPVLFLGAGVSKAAKLPEWKNLVSALFGYGLVSANHNWGKYGSQEFTKDLILRESAIIDALVNGKIGILDSNNVLETGQYVEEMLDGACMEPWVRSEELKEVLRHIIDKGTSAKEAKGVLQNGASKAENKEDWAKENTLLAVAHLLCTEKGFRQAITYNYDTYLEEYIQEIFAKSNNEVIVHVDGWNPYQSKTLHTDIFHVHGCIPTKYFREKKDLKKNEPRESKQIILSEDSYYGVEDRESYNWMNSVQSDALNKNSCIFVGFSGEDYNFRRILHQLGKYQETNRPKHYMLVTIGNTYEIIYNECAKEWSSETEEYAKVLLDRVLMAKEEYWGRFGFYPIWVTVQDIPEVLLSLIP